MTGASCTLEPAAWIVDARYVLACQAAHLVEGQRMFKLGSTGEPAGGTGQIRHAVRAPIPGNQSGHDRTGDLSPGRSRLGILLRQHPILVDPGDLGAIKGFFQRCHAQGNAGLVGLDLFGSALDVFRHERQFLGKHKVRLAGRRVLGTGQSRQQKARDRGHRRHQGYRQIRHVAH